MAFESINEKRKAIGNYRVSSGVRNGGKSLMIGMSKSCDGKSRQFCLRITESLAREARLLVGDRIDILIDEEARLGLVKRVTSGGWALSLANGSLKASAKPGSYYNCKIHCKYIEGLPYCVTSEECENVNVVDEGIMFAIPESASFKAP